MRFFLLSNPLARVAPLASLRAISLSRQTRLFLSLGFDLVPRYTCMRISCVVSLSLSFSLSSLPPALSIEEETVVQVYEHVCVHVCTHLSVCVCAHTRFFFRWRSPLRPRDRLSYGTYFPLNIKMHTHVYGNKARSIRKEGEARAKQKRPLKRHAER